MHEGEPGLVSIVTVITSDPLISLEKKNKAADPLVSLENKNKAAERSEAKISGFFDI